MLHPYSTNVANKFDEFEDLIVLMALWIIMPCSSWKARCFRGLHCLHLESWISLPPASAGFLFSLEDEMIYSSKMSIFLWPTWHYNANLIKNTWQTIWYDNNMLLFSTIQISSCTYYSYPLHWSAWSALLYIKSQFHCICMYMIHDGRFLLTKSQDCSANWSVGEPISLLSVANSITIAINVFCWEHLEDIRTCLRHLYVHTSMNLCASST